MIAAPIGGVAHPLCSRLAGGASGPDRDLLDRRGMSIRFCSMQADEEGIQAHQIQGGGAVLCDVSAPAACLLCDRASGSSARPLSSPVLDDPRSRSSLSCRNAPVTVSARRRSNFTKVLKNVRVKAGEDVEMCSAFVSPQTSYRRMGAQLPDA